MPSKQPSKFKNPKPPSPPSRSSSSSSSSEVNPPKPVSPASAVSDVKFGKEFLDNIIDASDDYTSNKIYFRYNVTKNTIKTENPTYKLTLNSKQHLYIRTLPEPFWMYIYTPDIIKESSKYDEPYEYNTHTDNTGDVKRFYKGNHISFHYLEWCNTLLFHYTEYDDTYNSTTRKICNFKIDDVTEHNMECFLCNTKKYDAEGIKEQYNVGKYLDGATGSDLIKYKYILNIIYRIITTIREKLKLNKQLNKNELKKQDVLRKRQEKQREKEAAKAVKEQTRAATAASTLKAKAKIEEDARRAAALQARKAALAEEAAAKNPYAESDAALLAYFGESAKGTKTAKGNKTTKNK